MQNSDEVEEVLRLVVAYIVYGVRWDWEAVFAGTFFWSVLHYSHNSFYDVIHVGEVALAVAIVEDLYRFAFYQLIGKAKVGHIGATCRAIDGEEAETGTGDVIQFRVGMCHQLIALLGSGIETDGIIHLVLRGIGYLFVTAIDRGTAGIDQLLHSMMTASLQDVIETYQIALDIAIGIGN